MEVERGIRTGVIEAVHPRLRARGELAVLGPDVVRLAEVVPSGDLDKGDGVAIRDDILPACGPKMLVTIIHELQKSVSIWSQWSNYKPLTFLLKVSGPKWVKNQGETAAM